MRRPRRGALEVIGSRWSILIVRELMSGPRRFTELQVDLAGIGPNVLAVRLHRLRDHDVIRQSRAAGVYELTELGEGLRAVVAELDRWGLCLSEGGRSALRRIDWLLRCLQGAFPPGLAGDLSETYECRIGADVFHIRIDAGAVEVRPGAAHKPAFTVRSGETTFLAVMAGVIAVEEVIARRDVQFGGDVRAAERAVAILGPNFDSVGDGHGILGAVRSVANPVAALGIDESYEFRVGRHVFGAHVTGGIVETRLGAVGNAAATIETELYVLLALGAGLQSPVEAAATGAAVFSGDVDAQRRMAAMFMPAV